MEDEDRRLRCRQSFCKLATQFLRKPWPGLSMNVCVAGCKVKACSDFEGEAGSSGVGLKLTTKRRGNQGTEGYELLFLKLSLFCVLMCWFCFSLLDIKGLVWSFMIWNELCQSILACMSHESHTIIWSPLRMHSACVYGISSGNAV